MNNRALIILLPLLAACLLLRAQNPCIEYYTKSDGLSDNYIYGIRQDSKKFMWFSSRDGLTKFDGFSFSVFSHKDGLATSQSWFLLEDFAGRLWVQQHDYSWNYIYNDKIFNNKNAPWLDSITKTAILFSTGDSVVYFETKNGLIALEKDNRMVTYDVPWWKRIFLITKSANGEFLVWADEALYKTKSLKEKPVKILSVNAVMTFLVRNNNEAFITMDSVNKRISVLIYSGAKLERKIQLPEGFPSEIRDIHEDAEGRLWIATEYNGLYCIRNREMVLHLDIQNITTINDDHENNIWVATRGRGVCKIKPCIFQCGQIARVNFNNDEIIGIQKNPNGGLWVTTSAYHYLCKNNTVYTLNFAVEGASFNKIVPLSSDMLFLEDRHKWPRWYFLPVEVTKIDKERKEVLCKNLVPSPIQGLNIWPNNSMTQFTYETENGYITRSLKPPFPIIDSIGGFDDENASFFYNSDNELVFLSNGGYLYRSGKLNHYPVLDVLKGKVIYGNSKHGVDFFFDDYDSIFLQHDNKVMNLTKHLDYPIEGIKVPKYYKSSMFINTQNYIYLCRNPLDIFEHKQVPVEILDVKFHDIGSWFVSDDTLYVSSRDGVTIMPVSSFDKTTASAPLPYFKSIQVNDIEYEWMTDRIDFRGLNKIRFELGCISYSSVPITFSYMLEGEDTAWTYGNNSVVMFHRLSPGKYTMKLRARKPASPWSNPIECNIVVRPTLVQHPLFYVGLLILFGAGFSWFIIRRKNKQLQRKELEHQLVLLEQKSMQSMMNPHFIFNALGSIQNYLMQNQSDAAGIYLSQFARLIRQNLGAISSGFINLSEEIERLRNYLDLEKMRVRDKFDYRINIDDALEEDEVMIPSMIIQPIVENSVWHGLAGLSEHGEVNLSFTKETEQSLKITIEDNGVGIRNGNTSKSKSQQHLHLGSDLTRRRLEMLGRKMGIRTSMEYSEKDPGSPHPGTRVVMVVPVSFAH